MHHPGPPRFVATGETVELAPRDPDPDATYRWALTTPEDSSVAVGSAPVEEFSPDVPGTYVAHLDAPDGTHDQTIRAVSAPAETDGGLVGGSAGAGSVGRFESGYADDHSRAPADPGGRPRITLEASIDDDRVTVRARPRPNPDGRKTPDDLSVAFVIDDRDAIDRRLVTVEDDTLGVPLAAIDEQLRVYATAVGAAGYAVPDAVAIERTDSGGPADFGEDGTADRGANDLSADRGANDLSADRGANDLSADRPEAPFTIGRPFDPPEWALDGHIYEIYVRGFPGQTADIPPAGERSVFDAIRDRLDHIESLGVDTLWLTPVLENDHAPHGYNVTDFFAIAEDLGSRADYERLLDAAHERGMRVLFDLVCNHSARDHPYYRAAVADEANEYHEFYEWRGPGDPETYFGWEHIANFDFTHLPVRRHLLDAIEQWAPLVDGFRIDMAWAVPDGFWREVHDTVKSIDSEFLLLDETIPYVPDFQAGCFDVHFDSTTYAALRRVGNGEDADALLDAIDDRARIGFPPHAGFMLYAENHDETRYIVDCGRESAMAATGALFTLPGAPMLYAGQEFGQRGQRDELAWGHVDEPLRSFVADLAALRHDEPALAARADLRRIEYDVREGWSDRVVAFARVADEARVVVLNFGEDPATVAVPGAASGADAVTGEDVSTADGLVVDRVAVLPADRTVID